MDGSWPTLERIGTRPPCSYASTRVRFIEHVCTVPVPEPLRYSNKPNNNSSRSEKSKQRKNRVARNVSSLRVQSSRSKCFERSGTIEYRESFRTFPFPFLVTARIIGLGETQRARRKNSNTDRSVFVNLEIVVDGEWNYCNWEQKTLGYFGCELFTLRMVTSEPESEVTLLSHCCQFLRCFFFHL